MSVGNDFFSELLKGYVNLREGPLGRLMPATCSCNDCRDKKISYWWVKDPVASRRLGRGVNPPPTDSAVSRRFQRWIKQFKWKN